MKAEIKKILEELLAKFDVGKTYLHKTTLGKQQMLTTTSSLTALIIKWLENADICDECKRKLLTNLTDRI
jgi:hypothetical protein